MNHCVRHYEETMAGTCRSCHAPFCSRCLVFAFGPKKPPFCIGCALNAGGVRNGYKVTPVVEPAATSVDRRAEKAAAKAAAKADKAAGKGRRGRGRRGGPEPVTATGGSPIPFDAGWAEAPAARHDDDSHDGHAELPSRDDHDVRVPATAQLASLMRARAGTPVGQPL